MTIYDKTGAPREDNAKYYEEIIGLILQENIEENLVGDMVNSIIDTPYEEVK